MAHISSQESQYQSGNLHDNNQSDMENPLGRYGQRISKQKRDRNTSF